MPLDIRIRFGRAIRRIREEQKINQEEAAERCGLHRTYYSGFERGVRGHPKARASASKASSCFMGGNPMV
jgi:transcriptional regulator with XRE-family HTH domain